MGELAADAVLSSLALGEIQDGQRMENTDLSRLVSHARFEIEQRHEATQERRDHEENAFREQRKITLTEQHLRRMQGIERRLQTVLERDRGQKVSRMIEGQLARQQVRYDGLMAEIESKNQKPVAVKYLAVCIVEVTHEQS
jgi:hypothetical protein